MFSVHAQFPHSVLDWLRYTEPRVSPSNLQYTQGPRPSMMSHQPDKLRTSVHDTSHAITIHR